MEINDKIDNDYSPSKWCPNNKPEEAIKQHVEIVSNKSNTARSHLFYESHYYKHHIPSNQNRYEYFPSTNSTKLIIYIHGGFWQLLDVESSSFMAEYWVGKGFCYAAIGYDRSPDVKLLEIILQVRQCVKSIIQTHSNIYEIFLIGHSAGAHLALTSLIYDDYPFELQFLNAELDKIKKVILISGIYDVRPICKTKNNLNLKLTEEKAWKLSPIRCINQWNLIDKFEYLIIVGEYDPPQFIEQSKNLYVEIKKNCTKLKSYDYISVDDKHHFDVLHDLGNEDYKLNEKIIQFIQRKI